MQRLHSLALGALLAVSTLASLPASAHATLQASLPAADAVLPQAPQQVQLTFNEKVEPAFSSIALQDETGKVVPTDKAQTDAAHPAQMTLALPALKSGRYIVRWVAVGPDGHRRTGQYGFSVK
ncbi:MULTISPECIES: copper homeostasis periplasmic binding protein CopC [Duganella]|jgi:methionine-rich copper-binding protein CopC|uniref:copper homeostasis periplasmic binding protein CopC n=1 Tax=Duganella TaxID=75654 RepID=UPI00159D478C